MPKHTKTLRSRHHHTRTRRQHSHTPTRQHSHTRTRRQHSGGIVNRGYPNGGRQLTGGGGGSIGPYQNGGDIFPTHRGGRTRTHTRTHTRTRARAQTGGIQVPGSALYAPYAQGGAYSPYAQGGSPYLGTGPFKPYVHGGSGWKTFPNGGESAPHQYLRR